LIYQSAAHSKIIRSSQPSSQNKKEGRPRRKEGRKKSSQQLKCLFQDKIIKNFEKSNGSLQQQHQQPDDQWNCTNPFYFQIPAQ
jgi:hypothetical protein